MVKIINKETLVKERFNSKYATLAQIFQGDAKLNKETTLPRTIGKGQIVNMTSENWVNSAGYHKLWGEIAELKKKGIERLNAAQAPEHSVLEALLGKVFIDITRRLQESQDYTSRICTEITNLEFAETVNLREFLPYIGEMQTIAGTNDSVPLIEQQLAETDTATMTIRALGWKDSLKNMLYNKIHTMQKVNQAAVDAHIDMRNARHIGVIVGTTFVASQKQAADATSGATYDVLIYNTFRKAIKKLRSLKWVGLETEENTEIAVPSISLLCNSNDTWSISRVINGQLQSAGTKGTLNTLNLSALPISEIIEYDRGINHGKVWGKNTLSFPGVTEGTCYIFVPREYAWVLNKRGLTMETGVGSTLQLSTEERAWYSVQTEYLKKLLGASYTADPASAGYGAIIEVTLPTDS